MLVSGSVKISYVCYLCILFSSSDSVVLRQIELAFLEVCLKVKYVVLTQTHKTLIDI